MERLTTKSDSPRIQRESSWFFALGLLTGIGMSGAFALGVWVASKGAPQPIAQVAPAGPDAGPSRIARAAPAQPAKPAPPVIPAPAPDQNVANRQPEPVVPTIVPVLEAGPTPVARPTMPERFALQEPPPQQIHSFLLPTDTWFALGKVSAEEPEAAEPMVCRADRTLGTSLTWARSPAEASERAASEGKLVFLIHVSGNFEDPGFT